METIKWEHHHMGLSFRHKDVCFVLDATDWQRQRYKIYRNAKLIQEINGSGVGLEFTQEWIRTNLDELMVTPVSDQPAIKTYLLKVTGKTLSGKDAERRAESVFRSGQSMEQIIQSFIAKCTNVNKPDPFDPDAIEVGVVDSSGHETWSVTTLGVKNVYRKAC